MWCVARLERPAKKNMDVWYHGRMVTMPDLGFDGVSSSLQSSCLFVFLRLIFNFFCIMYVTQTPQTTESTRAVQGACYNQLATTLYTPAAHQWRRKQHHTRAVVCPCCITVASWLLLLSDPAICRPAGLCCCVIHACCHRYYNTDTRYFITS